MVYEKNTIPKIPLDAKQIHGAKKGCSLLHRENMSYTLPPPR